MTIINANDGSFNLNLPEDIDKLRKLAEDDKPEGKYWARVSATLLFNLWEGRKEET